MNPASIYDVAALVLECVCDQMTEIATDENVPVGYDCPCLAYVSAGEPAIDCCTVECEQGGMLTVHVESVYPSDTFPSASADFQPCKAATWVATVVVTAARCAPTTDEQGNLASVEELSASAALMAVDQYAILTALSCCVVEDAPGAKRKRRLMIQESTPNVSEGGCASVEVRSLIELGPLCACSSGS